MSKEHDAYIINVNGWNFNMKPSLEKGDDQTRYFTQYSRDAVNAGGMSIVIGNDFSKEIIDKAITILTCIKYDKFGREAKS